MAMNSARHSLNRPWTLALGRRCRPDRVESVPPGTIRGSMASVWTLRGLCACVAMPGASI